MKALVLTTSYRQNGNTARVAGRLAEQLQALAAADNKEVEVETLNVARMQLQLCRGCRVCFDRGEAHCPLHDDLPAIKARMQAADILILASPVYVEDVNGVMKNWIDRLAHVCHRPEFAGKYALCLTTSGVGSTRHALRTINAALRLWGCYVVGEAGFVCDAYIQDEELEARHGRRIAQLARQLWQAVRQGRAARPPFLSFLIFAVQQRAWLGEDDGSIDYAYWARQGWLDRRCEYYIPHRAGRLKVALARRMGAILARFVL